MDLTPPNASVSAAVAGGVRPAVATARVDLTERLARFDALTATVLDPSGHSSEDQQIQAYQALQGLSVSGQLVGLDPDRRKLLDQATFESDIGKRAQDLSRQYIQAVNTAGQAGGASAALRAAQAAFDSLPASDQAVLFATTLNAADRSGAQPHANVQAWRDNTAAQLRIVDYMNAAGVVGPNGQLDHRAAAARSGDVKFDAALKLSLRRDNNSADWTRSVLALFGADRAPDRVDLSPEARKLAAEAPAAKPSTAPAADTYRAGSLVSRSI